MKEIMPLLASLILVIYYACLIAGCYLALQLFCWILDPSRPVPRKIEALFPLRGRWLKFGLVPLILTASWWLIAQPLLPTITKPSTRAKSCHANVRMMENAKAQWAAQHSLGKRAIPSIADLVGPDKYIKSEPQYPTGGTYTYGAMGVETICSAAAEHAREKRMSFDWHEHFGRRVRFR